MYSRKIQKLFSKQNILKKYKTRLLYNFTAVLLQYLIQNIKIFIICIMYSKSIAVKLSRS